MKKKYVVTESQFVKINKELIKEEMASCGCDEMDETSDFADYEDYDEDYDEDDLETADRIKQYDDDIEAGLQSEIEGNADNDAESWMKTRAGVNGQVFGEGDAGAETYLNQKQDDAKLNEAIKRFKSIISY